MCISKYELRKIRYIQRDIESIEESIMGNVRLVKELTGMPHGSGKSDPTGEAGMRLMELNEKLSNKLQEYYQLQSRFESEIDKLEPLEASIMRNYYINCMSWEQVAAKSGYTIRWVLELHGRILMKLKKSS